MTITTVSRIARRLADGGIRRRWVLLISLLCAFACLVGAARAQDAQVAPSWPNQVYYTVTPSDADPAVQQFNDPSFVVFHKSPTDGAEIAVFLPGTGGKPTYNQLLFHVVANQGYRVIGLMYDDDPAVIQVCPRNPNPDCSAQFREERIYGDLAGGPVQNPPAESIVHRLVTLLRYLDRNHPDENWRGYLDGDRPNWSRIVISGLSQGAGMSAYIAQREPVARVVLFSSPWDFQLPSGQLAPWISGPSITPPDRWFAEYHRRENTATLLSQSYQDLRIPPDHVLVFDLDLPPGYPRQDNPYHGSTVQLAGYIPQWQFLYGLSPDPGFLPRPIAP